MNRTIKFRAWDKIFKCYYYLTGFRLVGKNHIQLYYLDPDGDNATCTALIENIILEPFIGLEDKNGGWIYDGDIVTISGEDESEFIVSWEEDSARFIMTCDSESICVDFDNYYGKDCEIIGNIHEKAGEK